MNESFMCDLAYSYVIWLIHAWCVCGTTHEYVTWPIRVWPDSFICEVTHGYVTWFIAKWHNWFICDMTDSYVTGLIHVWHDIGIMTYPPSSWYCCLSVHWCTWIEFVTDVMLSCIYTYISWTQLICMRDAAASQVTDAHKSSSCYHVYIYIYMYIHIYIY